MSPAAAAACWDAVRCSAADGRCFSAHEMLLRTLDLAIESGGYVLPDGSAVSFVRLSDDLSGCPRWAELEIELESDPPWLCPRAEGTERPGRRCTRAAMALGLPKLGPVALAGRVDGCGAGGGCPLPATDGVAVSEGC